MTQTILGAPVRTRYTWSCPDCTTEYNRWDLVDLVGVAKTHYLQQHGPLDGQGEFGFDVARRTVNNPT